MGELRVNAANGKIAVDQPPSAVFAKTANGDIVLGAVACGEVVAETSWGRVESASPMAHRPGWSFARSAGRFATSSTLPAHQSRARKPSRSVLAALWRRHDSPLNRNSGSSGPMTSPREAQCRNRCDAAQAIRFRPSRKDGASW